MKKIVRVMMSAAVMISSLANANDDFSYVSTGLQMGRADNALLNDNQTESGVGAYLDASWNFYDNFFANYSISYNSYDGESWQHSWTNGTSSGSESGQEYFSTTRQYYSLGYFVPLGKFTPYLSLGVVSYEISGNEHESNQGAPGTTISYREKISGVAAQEIGTYYQATENYKIKLSYNHSAMKYSDVKFAINEFYFGNDYAFSNSWAMVGNISYRDFGGDLETNEVSTQVGVKYSF
ncbi:outer membrane beta-barrel protein [Aliivibrio fischeri]|uniref:outer membrane beta-barrel protein n=1 Tax=Aliivibrio fischeri TaxID=668 RepID=UPI00132BA351|nr:outer membrane beta-barrel protein [Aliivibrio fischeri]MUL08882.1 porin family protein [Aliivibrio fischeri]MUL14999.1 porin family protein [Aliivibrio fischeri]